MRKSKKQPNLARIAFIDDPNPKDVVKYLKYLDEQDALEKERKRRVDAVMPILDEIDAVMIEYTKLAKKMEDANTPMRKDVFHQLALLTTRVSVRQKAIEEYLEKYHFPPPNAREFEEERLKLTRDALDALKKCEESAKEYTVSNAEEFVFFNDVPGRVDTSRLDTEKKE